LILLARSSRFRIVLAIVAAFVVGGLLALALPWLRERWLLTQILDSGGVLSAEQAAYDVRRYVHSFRLDPERQRLAGDTGVIAVALEPLADFVLDLHRRLDVEAVTVDGLPSDFRHRGGRLTIRLRPPWKKGERHRVRVVFEGAPKVAALPPWIDGFVWERTPSGAPWIGVVTQTDGADDWWPAKDHPSDEPDEGVAIELTVPAGLVGLANGRRIDESTHADGSHTSRWEVSYPINNYLVTVNAGPYVEIVERYRGADGTLDRPMTFWALPEHADAARALWREAPEALAILARRFGEFPFLEDKIAAVEAPFDGMEHQTLIALGDGLLPQASGLYETLVHEIAHEWWGNQVTARDWDDFWIHEGFATYAEILYVEEKLGVRRARRHLDSLAEEIGNLRPMVEDRPRTSAEAYDHDLYVKGAWVLASLRWQIGDDAFFRALRRFAGEPGLCRLVDSAELATIVAEECACELGSFWDLYLRRAAPPRYSVERAALGTHDELRLAWDDPGFEVALPVRIGRELVRVEMAGGRGRVEVPPGLAARVETAGRLLAVPTAER
jgi:aminopeptidase N